MYTGRKQNMSYGGTTPSQGGTPDYFGGLFSGTPEDSGAFYRTSTPKIEGQTVDLKLQSKLEGLIATLDQQFADHIYIKGTSIIPSRLRSVPIVTLLIKIRDLLSKIHDYYSSQDTTSKRYSLRQKIYQIRNKQLEAFIENYQSVQIEFLLKLLDEKKYVIDPNDAKIKEASASVFLWLDDNAMSSLVTITAIAESIYQIKEIATELVSIPRATTPTENVPPFYPPEYPIPDISGITIGFSKQPVMTDNIPSTIITTKIKNPIFSGKPSVIAKISVTELIENFTKMTLYFVSQVILKTIKDLFTVANTNALAEKTNEIDEVRNHLVLYGEHRTLQSPRENKDDLFNILDKLNSATKTAKENIPSSVPIPAVTTPTSAAPPVVVASETRNENVSPPNSNPNQENITLKEFGRLLEGVIVDEMTDHNLREKEINSVRCC